MQVTDDKAFDWIRNSRVPFEPRSGRSDERWGVSVAAILPNDFAAYVKIFHRIEGHYENIDNPLDPDERKILELPECEVLRDFVQRVRTEPSAPYLSWRKVAEALKVPFQRQLSDEWFRAALEPGCWPRYVYGPSEGSLEESEVALLTSTLMKHSNDVYCYFRFAEQPYAGTDSPLLFAGRLRHLPQFLVETDRQFTPEYWWPEDRSWCLCSDYDLSFTVIGGSAELIDEVLACEGFESIRVTPDTRVDDFAPIEPE